MKRITLWVMSTLSALVLLFSYHTSTSAKASTSIVAAQESSAGIDSSASTTPTPTPTTAATYTGSVVSTRYGNVQVQITVENGQITKSAVLQVPWSNGRDQQINSRAVPTLNSEVVKAQSADIDMVSGATYTSDGYIQSLQSAIDQANL